MEEEIQTLFPDATTIRMDVDTTGAKNSHSEILNKFEKEKIDIKFIHAEINDNELILQGVTESPMLIDKAVRFASELYPEYSVKSVISVVQDFKTY